MAGRRKGSNQLTALGFKCPDCEGKLYVRTSQKIIDKLRNTSAMCCNPDRGYRCVIQSEITKEASGAKL